MIPMIGILVLTGLTIAYAAFRLVPRMHAQKIVFDNEPEPPRPFGYKMAWLAVQTENTNELIEVLELEDVTVSNWNSGLGTVYDEILGESHVFVSPPVNGWTFVIGLPLPHPVNKVFVDKLTPLLLTLVSRFPDVQYYFTYPLIDFFAWARATDGQLVRAFAVGDEGIVWNKGRTTREERALGLKLFELRGVRGRKGDAGGEIVLYPTEDHVLQVARGWSVDPSRLTEKSAPPGLGYIARAPMRWRTERSRRQAA